jgi:pyruvate dehydrogenase (quinone)
MANQAPTAIVIPSDVQELEYTPPGHAFKQVPSSLGISWPAVTPDDDGVRRAADILNAGSKVALLVGQGARGARAEIEEVAELLGAGVAKALLGKDVLPDDLPWVTGSIGLLGTRPSYEMMMGCDTLLTIGSNFPYTNFMPPLDQARGIQIDIDGRFIGMRYPYEVNLVGDAAATLRALLPHLQRKTDRSWREGIEDDVTRWWETMRMEAMVDADPVNPMRLFWELNDRMPADAMIAADSGSSANWYARNLKFGAGGPGLAVRNPRDDGPRRPLRHRREVRPPRPSRHRLRRRRGHADERDGRAHHDQEVLGAVV